MHMLYKICRAVRAEALWLEFHVDVQDDVRSFEAIENGALEGKGLELLYVDNKTDLFFMHIQGSGKIRIGPGSYIKLGYAGQNGHPYYPIGSHLIKNNLIDKKALYNNKLLYITNNNGLITFGKEENNNSVMFQDYFDIYVGLVSGKEKIYKHNKLGNIKVLNGKDKIDNYIYINKFNIISCF